MVYCESTSFSVVLLGARFDAWNAKVGSPV